MRRVTRPIVLTAAYSATGPTFTLPESFTNVVDVRLRRIKLNGVGVTPFSLSMTPKSSFLSADVASTFTFLPDQTGTVVSYTWPGEGRPFWVAWDNRTVFPTTLAFNQVVDEAGTAVVYTYVAIELWITTDGPMMHTFDTAPPPRLPAPTPLTGWNTMPIGWTT